MEPIFLISISLILLSVHQESAAALEMITVTTGSTGTFYCDSRRAFNFQKCDCEYSGNCVTVSSSRIKTNLIYSNKWKITILNLTQGDSGCYNCWQNWKIQWKLDVLAEKDPSVVVGKTGGSVVMPCAFGNAAVTSEKYWCREDQAGNCLKVNLTDPLGNFHIVPGTFSLEKQDLRPEDSGKYQCVVIPQYKHTIELQVLENKNGLSAPAIVNVTSGKQIKVACKYIQDYVHMEKSWKSGYSYFTTSFDVIDDRTRSELILSIKDASISDVGDYTCNVVTSNGYSNSFRMTLMVQLTAPPHVTGTKGGKVTIRCSDSKLSNLYTMFWCKVDSAGTCRQMFSSPGLDRSSRGRIENYYYYFNVIMENLEMNDSGLYRCGYKNQYSNKEVTTDVELQVVPQMSSTTSAVRRKTTRVTKADSTTKGTTGQSSLLYGIICLLVVVAFLLLFILLKTYFKRRTRVFSGRVQSPGVTGGTFYTSDLRNNSHLTISDRPNLQQPYTGCMDDSSSTSSESSGHSFMDISTGLQHQYLSIIPTPTDRDYENVPEGMPSALPDYENVTADKDMDYVNMSEPQNTSSTENKDSQVSKPPGHCESAASSESSSDESDSVNYSMVVFQKATQ